MNDDGNNKKPDSVTTSAQPRADQIPENEFLDRQAADARAAIEAAIERMRETIKHIPDIKAWTREYPWISLGAAAAVGFLSARLIAPGRREKASPELLEHLLADAELTARLRELAAAQHEEKPRLLGSVFSTLLKVVGGTLESALIAAITASVNPQPQDQAHSNGQPTEPDDQAPAD